MSKTNSIGDEKTANSVNRNTNTIAAVALRERWPIHVVYGGAHLFSADTPAKLGKRALESVKIYAPNFVEFAHAMNLPDTAHLPRLPKAVAQLAAQVKKSPDEARERDFSLWFAWTVHQRVLEKLKREPVEDFRIDFEDGYGSRSDDEEDDHARTSSNELAKAFIQKKITAFCGFRVKSFNDETRKRANRTLDIFLENLLMETNGALPDGFSVTLPKVTHRRQVKQLCKALAGHEKRARLKKGSIAVEIMIEMPEAIIDAKGRVPLRDFVEAADHRRVSAHFGAFDYTSSLSIAAPFQDMRHPSCDFARNVMQASLAPLGVRLADSVTTELPVPLHRGDDLSKTQTNENQRAVHAGWRVHFENVRRSMSAGFYQSWDLHPNQLPARFAAAYSFYLYNYEAQARRLKAFIDKAAQASLSGSSFDDAASAHGVVNFFIRALDCGALTEKEVEASTGLSASQIKSISF